MKRAILSLSLVIVFSLTATSQKVTKIFYDSLWKGCSETEASFYRIVTFDLIGKPIGKIKDYYITGQLQSVLDGAYFIDKEDDKNSKFWGMSRGYYKSGKIQFENVRDKQSNYIYNKRWFENGKLKYTVNFKNGKRHGLFTYYYDNGNIRSQIQYNQENIVGTEKFFNESGKIHMEQPIVDGIVDTLNQKTYYYNDNDSLMAILIGFKDDDGFITGSFLMFPSKGDSIISFFNHRKLDSENADWVIHTQNRIKKKPYAIFEDKFESSETSKNWNLSDNENATDTIQDEKLKIHFYKTKSVRRVLLNTSLFNLTNNEFEIKTIINKNSSAFFEGIIFGFKDYQNYSAITFSRKLKTLIYEKYENGITTFSDEARNIYIDESSDNEVRIIKKYNVIKVFFNGQEGYQISDVKLSGNLMGVCATAIKEGEEALFNSFYVSVGEQPSAGFKSNERNNVVSVKKVNGVFTIPVELNDVLKIDFIFDSGASDVSISPDIALTLIKAGTIGKDDWLPGAYYSFADGSKAKSARFKLKSIIIGNKRIENIVCSISNSINAPMLLGQSVLGKFGRYTFDNAKQILTIE
ncbi:MAG: retroviral-like aspartic protease family protein [Flavobacterium sp.]|nr:retroviral-like aspartic protease family protein [Flavobacterium sp.]